MINKTVLKVAKGAVSVGAIVFPLANGIIKSKAMEKNGEMVANFIVNMISKKTK